MSNEIDRLMDLDPLDLSAQDIDDIIKYQRKMKANFAAGVKAPKGEAPQKVDILSLLKDSIPQAPKVTRR